MKVIVTETAFEPFAELAKYEANINKSKVGGIVNFIGTMRDFNDGSDVVEMYLEHYPGMTEKHIEQVCKEASERWDIIDSLVVHRYGRITPCESIVLVAVWSAHRAEAFDACRFIINYLKKRAPFWKCESSPEGGKRWVEHNTADPKADLKEDGEKSGASA